MICPKYTNRMGKIGSKGISDEKDARRLKKQTDQSSIY